MRKRRVSYPAVLLWKAAIANFVGGGGGGAGRAFQSQALRYNTLYQKTF